MHEPVRDPSISVVVLTHERPETLRACLASLRAQEIDDTVEIVVADDGSGPATAAVIASARALDPRIVHVRHEHRGIPATRNLGVGAAHGHLIAIVADDYVLAPHYLRVARDYLAERPDAAVVRFDINPTTTTLGARVSHCYYAASVSRRLASESISTADAHRGVRTMSLEAAGAAVFRSEVLAEVGPWNESLQRAEDTEHTDRLRALGHEVHVLFAGTVRHAYRAFPVDTVRKCFVTGIYRARLIHHPAGVEQVTSKAGALARALGRARSDGRPVWSVALYIPWMVVFEASVGAGLLWARLTPARGNAAGRPAATAAPARR